MSLFVSLQNDSKETRVTVIKPGTSIDPDDLPSEIFPSGLSEERKQYLFEQIRPFCDEKYRDVTCPKPRRRKRPQPSDTQASTAKSKRLCSYRNSPISKDFLSCFLQNIV